jgi:hypothetical protein
MIELPLYPGARPCVRSGFCCKQAPCGFGKWNDAKTQCAHLEHGTDGRYVCAIVDDIMKDPTWVVSPAFGAGCCSPMNLDRRQIIANMRKPMPTIHFSTFARKRHVASSQYSHFDISEQEVLERVMNSHDRWIQGYRSGVILVPIDPQGFWSSTAVLNERDTIHGDYRPRKEGEEPRKSTWIYGDKVPALAVDVVLYSHDVLQEGDEAESLADYEIISINAHPTNENNVPMRPGTLMANHFTLSGGTATNMSPEAFVASLKRSVMYWKDKIEVRPHPLRDFDKA